MSLVYRTTLLLLALAALCLAQESTVSEEIARLREQIAAQQKQLNEQRQALEAAQKALDAQQKLLDKLTAATAPVAAAPAPAPAAAPAPRATAANVDTKGKPFSPLSFRIGGAEFTPGGFVDVSTAWRSTTAGNGIVTPFGSIPFSNTPAGRLSEIRTSAQNSRIALKITDNPTKNLTVTAWIEADFWGYQPGNAYVVSNSSTLRMRQFWVNLQRKKWELMAGQAWTLLTPNRNGVSSNPADLFIGLGQDSNYLLGLIWGRSGQFRAVYHPNKNWSIAASAESPEQYVTGAVTLPASIGSQVSNGTAANSSNVRPDLIAKIAYDTKVSGRAFHVEAAGLWRQFRTSPAPGVHFGAQGFGGSVNGVLEVAKNFRLILTSFYSSGGGRFIIGLAPDMMVGPDGSISPVHSMSGIGGFEYGVRPDLVLFSYYGGMYARRNYAVVGPNSYLGFGFPGSSSSANRQIQEATFGFMETFWRNPNYGALQLIGQYSYLTRSPWYAAPGTPANAQAHMLFGGFRFTLP